jgi:tetratricopeptide (TPR) repeat protein
VRVYDVENGQTLRSFSGGEEPFLALAFSPDGGHLAASGFLQRTVLLWDLAQKRPTVTHQGPEGAMDLAFSPDGRRLALASRLMIKLLDAATGEEVLVLRGFAHLNPDSNGFNPRVRFSPDGRLIAAICHDYKKPVSIWSVEESGKDLAARQQAANRRALVVHLEDGRLSPREAKPRASFLFHLKWLEQAELTAAADYAARGALFACVGKWDRATADFTRATELAPNVQAIWYECGAGLAAAGRWEQSLPYFSRFAELGRGVGYQWQGVAAVPLYLNDTEAYRRFCQNMLVLFGRSQDPEITGDLLSWGLLMGDSGVGPQVFLPLADRCLTVNEKQWAYGLMAQAKGIADYRAGQFEQAIAWLRKAAPLLRSDRNQERLVNDFFLGMAYQRMNRTEDAKAAYQRGLELMEQLFGGLDQYQPGRGEWYAWPRCQVIRREAEALIVFDPIFPADPFAPDR